MPEERSADVKPLHQGFSYYSPKAREEISRGIKWKPEADREKFFEILEQLAFGLTHTQNPEAGDPRHTRERLESVTKAVDKLNKAVDELEREFRKLDKLQSETGSVRLLMPTWGWSSEDGTTPRTWDDVSDARGTLIEFASAAKLAVERFRTSMGTSPRKVNPTLGWAEQVWTLYRKVDANPEIGKRDHKAGRFQALLDKLADEIKIEISWLTIQRHLQEKRRKADQSRSGT